MNRTKILSVVLIFSLVSIFSVRPSVESKKVPNDANPVAFAPTAFAGNNAFYLGSAEANKGALALVRMHLVRDTGKWQVEAQSLAPKDGVSWNGAAVANDILWIYDKKLEKIALCGTDMNPVVIRKSTVAGTRNTVALVTDTKEGKEIYTNDNDRLKDAANVEVANKDVAAFAASEDTIFAAFGPADGDWGDANSGIIRLEKSGNELKVRKREGKTGDGLDSFGNDRAYKIDLGVHNQANSYSSSYEKVQFAATEVDQDPGPQFAYESDLYWDRELKRLYVGLGVVAVNNKASASIQSLLMGRIDDNKKMYLQSVVDLQKSYSSPYLGTGEDDAHSSIIGYKNAIANNFATATFKVRTMHTSTGKSYVIVNGGATNIGNFEKLRTKVYALPLVRDGAGKGLIARKNDHSQPVGDAKHMVTAAEDATKVGGVFQYLAKDTNQDIQHMQVVGDTVYVSLAGDRTADTEAGIFSSTAVFDQNGVVKAWTPWQRVVGSADKVAGFGFDSDTQKFWCLEGENQQAVKVTDWNAGATNIHKAADGSDKTLGKALESFKGDNGLYGQFDFDDSTAGFATYDPSAAAVANRRPRFSMMVATGYEKVALIQGGTRDGDVFKPTKEFDSTTAGVDKNVYTFDKTKGLDGLGQITCAEVSRVGLSGAGDTNFGWIFVGGQGGFAVLKNDNGYGWQTTQASNGTGLDELKHDVFPGNNVWSFQKMSHADADFTQVRKLVADGHGFIYVLTRSALYRVEAANIDFNAGVIHDDRFKEVVAAANMKNNAGADFVGTDEFFDLFLMDKTYDAEKIVIATNKGLYTNSDVILNANTQSKNFKKMQVGGDDDKFASGPVLKLDFIDSTRGGPVDGGDKAIGNLYALALDEDSKNLNVYRFYVGGGEVKAITEPYTEEGAVVDDNNRTDYFYKIGKIDKDLQPYLEPSAIGLVGTTETYGSDNADFATSVPQVPNPDDFLNAGKARSAINLGHNFVDGVHWDGVEVQDSASGAIYIPGEFGVLVNE